MILCAYSMIADHYFEKWSQPPYQPTFIPLPYPVPNEVPGDYVKPRIPSQEEIDEFYKLLERARKYDEENNQKDCELEDKKKKLLDLAKELGIEINFP